MTDRDRLAAEVAAQVMRWPWVESVTLIGRGGNQKGKRRFPVRADHVYALCYCGGRISIVDGQRVPCTCGSTMTADEATELANASEREGAR